MLNASGVNSDNRRIIWLEDSKNRLYCYHHHQLEHISLPNDAAVVQVGHLPSRHDINLNKSLHI